MGPRAGIVGDIPGHEGDRVAVTTLLTTVDEPGSLEAYIYVPADRGRELKVGLPVHLLDQSGKPISDARAPDIPFGCELLRYRGGCSTDITGQDSPMTAPGGRRAYVIRAPVGWVGPMNPRNLTPA